MVLNIDFFLFVVDLLLIHTLLRKRLMLVESLTLDLCIDLSTFSANELSYLILRKQNIM